MLRHEPPLLLRPKMLAEALGDPLTTSRSRRSTICTNQPHTD